MSSNQAEIYHSAQLLIYELINFQRDFEIPDGDMVSILQQVMRIIQEPEQLAGIDTPLPVCHLPN